MAGSQLDRDDSWRAASSTSCTSARSRPRARWTPRSGGSTTSSTSASTSSRCCRSTRSTASGTGATTACSGTRCRSPTAAPPPTSASSTPATSAGSRVIQDVVYNHLGPSGNYLPEFGPYLHEGRANTWGASLNLDGPDSDAVREHIIRNALMWLDDYRVDGLRLDAVHALVDHRAVHLLEELAERVDALSAHVGRPLTLIAESDLNDPRMIRPREAHGYGITAQWSDDFHHAVHVAVSGETAGYYEDFAPLTALADVLERGFFHARTTSTFRGRVHGRPIDVARTPAWRLVVVRPGPRPGRQPRRGRPARGIRRRRRPRDRRGAHRALAVHADAVHGRGVGGVDAVAVLHVAPRARARPGDGRGAHRGVRAHGLGSRCRARPAGPRDVPAFEARLARAVPRGRRRHPPDADAAVVPGAHRPAPRTARAHRPAAGRHEGRDRRGRAHGAGAPWRRS